MSFREGFKTLLEELVLPEVRTLKSQVREIRAELCLDTDSLKSELNTLIRTQDEKMDLALELIQEVSEKVKALTNSRRD